VRRLCGARLRRRGEPALHLARRRAQDRSLGGAARRRCILGARAPAAADLALGKPRRMDARPPPAPHRHRYDLPGDRRRAGDLGGAPALDRL
ncbi:MAG: hypothetical protein AVDCRST_MAG91-440, partial [uncultured Sphingomonadaceae bacterium]